MTTYFGFAIADSMFEGDYTIERRRLSAEEARERIAAGVECCCNPSHQETIKALRMRCGVEVAIPATPPRVVLGPGDAIIVMGVRELPRLTDRHEYGPDEIAGATFSFAQYTVVDGPSERGATRS